MSVKQLGATPLSTNKGKKLLCNLWQQLWQRLLSHRPHTSVCPNLGIAVFAGGHICLLCAGVAHRSNSD